MKRYLLMEQAGTLYALPAEVVLEVVMLPWLSRRPGPPRGVLGVVDYRGLAVLAIDLESRLGGENRPLRSTDQLVVLQPQAAAAPVALRVEKTLDLGPLEEAVQSLQEPPWPELAGLALGQVRVEDQVALVLDPQALAEIARTALEPALEGPEESPPELTELDRNLLGERARELARPAGLPEPAAALNLVVFGMGGERFALEVEEVEEFTAGAPVTPVPGGPAHLLGLAYHRGRLLRVIDLRAQLGLVRGAEIPVAVVILRGPGMLTGLAVDRVEGVMSSQPPVGANAASETPGIRWSWSDGGGWLNLLELDQLQVREPRVPGAAEVL